MGTDAGRLTWAERAGLARLALPSFALSLAITTVGAYGPLLIADLAGASLTGLLIGGEGLFALLVAVLVGRWSDRAGGRWGARLPFLLGAAPVAAVALGLLPFADSLLLVAAALGLFFAAYFTYLTPYLAAYPDLLPPHVRGRSQGALGTFRELGLGAALVGGGLLIDAWRPLPFLLAAATLLAVTLLTAPALRGAGGGTQAPRPGLAWQLVRDLPGLRGVLVANVLWEFALASLRAFSVLFLTVGLGRSASAASAIMALVVPTAVLGALVSGTLADRLGARRVLLGALALYGPGLLVAFFTQSTLALVALPVVGFAAAVVMTLPYALVMEHAPQEDAHGAAAGLYTVSRGVGLLLGPLVTGVAIELLAPVLADTQGYVVLFPVCALAVTATIPILLRAPRRTPEHVAPRRGGSEAPARG